eukprot:gene17979-biopygen18928
MSIPCTRPLCSNEKLGMLSAINVRIAGVHMNIVCGRMFRAVHSVFTSELPHAPGSISSIRSRTCAETRTGSDLAIPWDV